MSIFKKVNDTFAKVGESGKSAAATMQLKSEIRKLENELDSFYQELESYYGGLGRAYENMDEDELLLWLEKVKECKNIIALKEDEINALEPQIAVCENCGKDLSQDAKFCGACGTKIMQVSLKKTCKSCGNINDSTSNFCLNCGEKLVEALDG